MAHLFVLFPTLIILATVSHRFYQKYPETVAFYYFRNFFGLWSVCTFFAGIIAVAGIQAPLKPLLGAAIGVPFYYFAMAYLIRLPFAMYKKMGAVPNLLSAVIVLSGISIGAGNYFVKVLGSATTAGFLEPLMKISSGVDFRVWTTGLFLVPIGLFFLYEATRSVSGVVRVSAIIVGIGIIAAGIGEPQHVVAKHASIADFGVAIAFVVMLIGLSIPFLLRPREVGERSVAASAK